MAHLSLSLLGSFQVTLDGEPIAGFRTRKAGALLAYLAVEALMRLKGHSRTVLAGLLWPGKPERAALTSLRTALADLRTAIGDRDATPPYLQVTRETIQFNLASDHWLDVAGLRSPAAPFSFPKQNNPSNSILKQLTRLSFHGKMYLGVRIVESC